MNNYSNSHNKSNKFKIPKKLLLVFAVILLVILLVVTAWYLIVQAQKPTANSLQQALTKASRSLEDYKKANNNYPESIDCNSNPADKTICLKAPNGVEFVYQPDNENDPKTFTLYAKNDVIKYRIYASASPKEVAAICPLGFINVPGSSVYNTTDFCVMKYEAKAKPSGYGTGSSGLPLQGISQQQAVEISKKVCDGCQLITEAQWLTLARDVLSVPSNWSSGTVGNGYIFSGHSDRDPNEPLPASLDDSDGLFETKSTDTKQRRTLTLTNGEVIWDMAGNVYELSQDLVTGGQPGQDKIGYKMSQWPSASVAGTMKPSPFPAATGLQGADKWTTENGIGMLYSNTKENQTKAIARGGSWNDNANGTPFSGVMTMLLMLSPSQQAANAGFRVTK